jgi:hypothetical protein
MPDDHAQPKAKKKNVALWSMMMLPGVCHPHERNRGKVKTLKRTRARSFFSGLQMLTCGDLA